MDRWLSICLWIVFLGFGGFLLWGTLIPLSEGVTAAGRITLGEERQAIQHLEGGILSDIHVKEGQVIAKGDVLFEIDRLAVTANRDQIALERANGLAAIDRINALLSDTETEFPSQTTWQLQAPLAETVRVQQRVLFEEQRANHRARLGLLNQKRVSLTEAAEAQSRELDTINHSLELIDTEIQLKQGLVDKKLMSVEGLQGLLRERSELSSEKASVESRLQQTQSRKKELSQERLQLETEFREQQSRELLEAKAAVATANEKLKTIGDAVQRTAVRAPVDGEVLNLNFSTIGGVVRAGEVMLEIVPASNDFWVTLQVLPQDREAVYAGLDVNVRLSGFKSWKSPTLYGEVMSVSADLKQIPETGLTYYEARIRVELDEMKNTELGLITPGMPVEAFVDSGNSRTVLNYLLEPIVSHFSKGLSSG